MGARKKLNGVRLSDTRRCLRIIISIGGPCEVRPCADDLCVEPRETDKRRSAVIGRKGHTDP